ncbi:C6 zinc finger domain-containing protein [Beauveria bassiana ARSEF 2860]|uniref:C6 zinc finger domain-containing protein n=1 Tax=Beauveria bassiana (strain ARSEF 2860) TaxID=655819 RepID=J4UFY6_BEAB2|nr:C6 zinc finger domain-containing protein [Beauveria bassiana ARSEF 2860]EJP61592.1 C6 zinc finger domain-containing protein [Beauveria bassiana ARSEF 2860]
MSAPLRTHHPLPPSHQHPSSAPAGQQSHPLPYPTSLPSTPGHGLMHHPDIDHQDRVQEALAPMHDHYHPPQTQPQQLPPHSPAQPRYPPCSSRDSFIQREGPEDNRGPDSASHGLDGSHGSASHFSAPPLHPNAYSSAPQHHVNHKYTSQPTATSSNCHHPEPSAFMQPRQADENQGQPSYSTSAGGQPMDGSLKTLSSVVPAKKKNTRASQACESCRQLKANGLNCEYSDPPLRSTDKTHSEILKCLAMMQPQLTTFTELVAQMNKRLTNIESALKADANLKLNPAARGKPTTDDQHKTGDTSFTEEKVTKSSSQDAVAAGPDQTIWPEDEVETKPGPPSSLSEPAIPMNHITPAGLLLNWPSIQELTKHHLEREGVGYVGEYPISQERNRCLLISYGRSEDNRMSRKKRKREHDQQSVDMLGVSCDSPSASTATEAADWGTVGCSSLYDQVGHRSAILGPDDDPDFSEAKIWSYVKTFEEKILNMHPIVQPRILHQWVRQFLDSLPLPRSQYSNKLSTAWNVSSSMESTGSTRKKPSPAPNITEISSAASSTPGIGRLDRTINTALVLTVLALGKVCQHRDYVPDALYMVDPMLHGNGRFHLSGTPPLSKSSSPGAVSRSQSSSLASPSNQDHLYHSRRSSLAGNTRPGLLVKNYENIPGLEYFAFATDILGNHHESYNNMKNVYAYIFAGLFQGQLGRPLESLSFIQKASHKLQVIMKPSLEKLKSFKTTQEFIKDTKCNQLSLAFWTCLQLESDLLAEFPLPPSGLLCYENDIPHPNMSLLEGFLKPVLDSYLGQIYLRTHLNSIHRMLYAPEDLTKGGRADIPLKNIDFVSDAVSGMEWVAPSFAFREDDPPASDILSARLRAKYWGAQVLTYRPFLRQILQHSFVENHSTNEQLPSVKFRAEFEAPQLLVFARKAIKALIESTRAFHGLGEKRPIITNVFGTAHAQWGNLLVLSAAFKDPIMGRYIDEKLLRHLFPETIRFLR